MSDQTDKPKTPAERKREERERHRAAGRVPVQVWVRPEHRAQVRALERALQDQVDGSSSNL